MLAAAPKGPLGCQVWPVPKVIKGTKASLVQPSWTTVTGWEFGKGWGGFGQLCFIVKYIVLSQVIQFFKYLFMNAKWENNKTLFCIFFACFEINQHQGKKKMNYPVNSLYFILFNFFLLSVFGKTAEWTEHSSSSKSTSLCKICNCGTLTHFFCFLSKTDRSCNGPPGVPGIPGSPGIKGDPVSRSLTFFKQT